MADGFCWTEQGKGIVQERGGARTVVVNAIDFSYGANRRTALHQSVMMMVSVRSVKNLAGESSGCHYPARFRRGDGAQRSAAFLPGGNWRAGRELVIRIN